MKLLNKILSLSLTYLIMIASLAHGESAIKSEKDIINSGIKPASFFSEFTYVPIIDLSINPVKYNNKKVKTVALWRTGFELSSLGNTFWFNPGVKLGKIERNKTDRSRRYAYWVVAYGVIAAKEGEGYGHLGRYSCEFNSELTVIITDEYVNKRLYEYDEKYIDSFLNIRAGESVGKEVLKLENDCKKLEQ